MYIMQMLHVSVVNKASEKACHVIGHFKRQVFTAITGN